MTSPWVLQWLHCQGCGGVRSVGSPVASLSGVWRCQVCDFTMGSLVVSLSGVWQCQVCDFTVGSLVVSLSGVWQCQVCDFTVGSPVASLSGVWWCQVCSNTGDLGANLLLLGEIASVEHQVLKQETKTEHMCVHCVAEKAIVKLQEEKAPLSSRHLSSSDEQVCVVQFPLCWLVWYLV